MKSLRDSLLSGGRCPQTPGIYRLGARMAALGGGRSRPRPFRRLSRRSPYPRLRYFQSGSHQPRRAILLQRTATTPLTDCLTIGVHCTEGDPHPALAPCPTNPISGSFLDWKTLTESRLRLYNRCPKGKDRSGTVKKQPTNRDRLAGVRERTAKLLISWASQRLAMSLRKWRTPHGHN